MLAGTRNNVEHYLDRVVSGWARAKESDEPEDMYQHIREMLGDMEMMRKSCIKLAGNRPMAEAEPAGRRVFGTELHTNINVAHNHRQPSSAPMGLDAYGPDIPGRPFPPPAQYDSAHGENRSRWTGKAAAEAKKAARAGKTGVKVSAPTRSRTVDRMGIRSLHGVSGVSGMPSPPQSEDTRSSRGRQLLTADSQASRETQGTRSTDGSVPARTQRRHKQEKEIKLMKEFDMNAFQPLIRELNHGDRQGVGAALTKLIRETDRVRREIQPLRSAVHGGRWFILPLSSKGLSAAAISKYLLNLPWAIADHHYDSLCRVARSFRLSDAPDIHEHGQEGGAGIKWLMRISDVRSMSMAKKEAWVRRWAGVLGRVVKRQVLEGDRERAKAGDESDDSDEDEASDGMESMDEEDGIRARGSHGYGDDDGQEEADEEEDDDEEMEEDDEQDEEEVMGSDDESVHMIRD